MIYSRYNHELGNVDAYDRVLDGEHRIIVKQVFNAMMQAKTDLEHKPKTIDLQKSILRYPNANSRYPRKPRARDTIRCPPEFYRHS